MKGHVQRAAPMIGSGPSPQQSLSIHLCEMQSWKKMQYPK